MSDLMRDLTAVINRYSLERTGGNTPDFLLAEYLIKSLEVFGQIVEARKAWGGERPSDMQQVPLPDSHQR